jgi:hypothetical protein
MINRDCSSGQLRVSVVLAPQKGQDLLAIGTGSTGAFWSFWQGSVSIAIGLTQEIQGQV